MTNQEKFIQIFGVDVWRQMIVFSGLSEQFKEYWTSPYLTLTIVNKEVEPQESEEEDSDNLDSMLEDLWNATESESDKSADTFEKLLNSGFYERFRKEDNDADND